jgi:hypothetical protein
MMRSSVLLLCFLSVSGCKGEELWTGIVYPEGVGGDESRWRIKPGFKSLEACRDWTMAETGRLRDSAASDYECGLNCKPGSPMVCEKTLR